MPILIFLIAHWYLSAFAQTFFLHRYGAHQMFTMPIFWERFFHVFTFLTQGPSYLNPRAYAVLHRMHHAHSDTELDPHSPAYHRTPFGMMNKTLWAYLDAYSGKLKAPSGAGSCYPEWPAFEKIAEGIPVRVLFALSYLFFYLKFASEAWMYIFLPVHIFMGPIHGAIVNWCGHKYGYTNFDNGDKSKNTFCFDILTMGELMQNNHHRHSLRPNFAVKWFEFDPVYPLIKLFHRSGMIRILSK